MQALVGFTGFVGSNLCEQTAFDGLFNSQNFTDIARQSYDLVVYAGIRAEKFLANANPEADLAHVQQAMETITKIRCDRFVLISTIDIYGQTADCDESMQPEIESLQPYGQHRRWLELAVLEEKTNALVVRLPALFGNRLKKNFIYDMMTIIPTMLRPTKLAEIASDCPVDLTACYQLEENGFFRLRELAADAHNKLFQFFRTYRFNALSFTDSRNAYQFYHLSHLWEHLQCALAAGMPVLNITTEPLITGELFRAVYQRPFINELAQQPIAYDIKSQYANLFKGHEGYLQPRETVVSEIKSFVKGWQ